MTGHVCFGLAIRFLKTYYAVSSVGLTFRNEINSSNTYSQFSLTLTDPILIIVASNVNLIKGPRNSEGCSWFEMFINIPSALYKFDLYFSKVDNLKSSIIRSENLAQSHFLTHNSYCESRRKLIPTHIHFLVIIAHSS